MSKAERIRQQRAREKIAAQQAAARRAEKRRRLLIAGGGLAAVAAIAVTVIVLNTGPGKSNSGGSEVIPPAVTGPTTAEPPALQVANTSGIKGVVAYDTTGWPSSSNNGPKNRALGHKHVPGPVTYSVTPPVGGDHNGVWMNCGVYARPVPNEHAVHDLEHGAVWITYQPTLPTAEVTALRAVAEHQRLLSFGGVRSRYTDLTPYPGLPAPIVVSSWGFQLRLSSATDPRLQQFINKFRASRQFTPEYGGECTGGVGTPLEK